MTRKQSASVADEVQHKLITDLGSRAAGQEDLAISKRIGKSLLNVIEEQTRNKESTIASPTFRAQERASRSGETPQLFPMILHRMLEDAESDLNDHIVGWDPDGLSFKIHKPNELAETIMPRYFKNQTKFRSFQRQVRRSFRLVCYCCFAFSVY
jgi:hypothetical protein